MRNTIYILMLLLVWGCGQSYEEKKAMTRAERQRLRQQDSLALKVGVLPTVDCMPIYLAKAHGFFDKDGVDVHLREWNAQMDCDTALTGGSIEGAVSDRKRVERMEAGGTPLSIAGSTNAYWQLISNRTARIKRVGQLGDKMVAMTRYSATDFLTDEALRGVKTSASVFRIQINDVTIRLQMLLNNEMDAMWLTEPQATTARLHRNPVIKDSRQMKQTLGVVVFRTKALADKRRRQQAERFVKSYNRACDSLNARGLRHYGSLVKTCCKTDQATLDSLPKMRFAHIGLK